MTSTESTLDGHRARSRWVALVQFGLRHVVRRTRSGASWQYVTTVVIIALVVSLLVVIAGISVELADEPGIEDADLQVVPADRTSLSTVVNAEAPQLADVHPRSTRVNERDSVVYSTPMLVDVVRLRTPESTEPVYVLAIGVVPGPEAPSIAGMPTNKFGDGDPYYANGSYEGDYTGDLLLSEGAADQLNAAVGDGVSLQSTTTGAYTTDHEVTGVEGAEGAAGGRDLPIAVFRLSELQHVVGADHDDLADRIVVRTEGDPESAESVLETTFPNASVVGDGGIGSTTETVREHELALALSATATVVGGGVAILVVATTTALLVESNRHILATLAVLGFSRRARLGYVALTAVGLTMAGGLLGGILGTVGIAGVNAITQIFVVDEPIARTGIWIVPYCAGIVLSAAIFAAPYPVVLASRVDAVDDLERAG